MTSDQIGETFLVEDIALPGRHTGQRGDFFRVAGNTGDRVATVGEFLEQARTGCA